MNETRNDNQAYSHGEYEDIKYFAVRAKAYIDKLKADAQENGGYSQVRVPLKELFYSVYDDVSMMPKAFEGESWEDIFHGDLERVILGCKKVSDSLITRMLEAMWTELRKAEYYYVMFGGVSIDYVDRRGSGNMVIRWR